jgi:thioesterase domain-containing protein
VTDAAVELEALIRTHIPLSRALDFGVASLDDGSITVRAPLEPNINIHGTAFAGSLYALGMLSAWGLCTHLLRRSGVDADLVVTEATIRYRRPVSGPILCRCEVAPEAAAAFVSGVVREDRATLTLSVTIGDGPAARMQATMHARRRRERPSQTEDSHHEQSHDSRR